MCECILRLCVCVSVWFVSACVIVCVCVCEYVWCVCMLYDMAYTVSFHYCRKWDVGLWVFYSGDQNEKNDM